MTTITNSEYDEAEARAAAAEDYRTAISGDDSLVLDVPLAGLKLRPTFQRQTIGVSLRFAGSADTADITVIYWGRSKAGALVCLGVSETVTVPAAPQQWRVTAGGDFHGREEPFDSHGIPLYEVRVTALTGTIAVMKTWVF